MTGKGVRVRGFFNHGSGAFEIFASIEHKGVDKSSTTVVFEAIEVGALRKPAFSLTEDQAGELMSDLWNAGFRPRGAKNEADLVAALKFHRDDAVKVRDRALDVVLVAHERKGPT